MRGLKTTIALLVVLGGLAGYIFFYEARREPADPNAKPRAFDQLSSDSIQEIEITNADGDTSRAQLDNGNWQLVQPVKADADDGVVGTVTSNLASLEVQRVVEEKPADLKQYGLEPARIDVGFRLKDQKEFQHLLVGDKTATGGDVYAKRPNEPRVFLISSYLDSIFNKAPFDLRDKVILKFERDKVDGVELSEGTSAVQFTRNGSEWRIAKPIAARADYAAAEGLLTRLSSTHMLKVVDEDAADLRKYGLDRPSLAATVMAGSTRATLQLGGKAADGGFFAKDAARPTVFTVEEALATDLGKDVFDFRRKDLFDARSFSASRLELRRGAADPMVFEKREEGGKTTWRNASGQTIDAPKVEDAVMRLSNLQAQAFQQTAHASLKTPVATATVRFDENKTETVTFGRSGNDVFASRSDEPGSARVDPAAFDEAMKAVDAMK
ncbi:MAG: hypothetical protein A3I61_04470 [Acidobacteria bacterium RIFCSPLOWO2_02_FULL_68_18]|nr:MAG: hypothetical protein A3I61_04470 [Acidobacteria bacterium RIFCSPLOWO2_02_FULL_68_18]OFW48415.1 MAG: hypothetical protein A3G77_13075 [Acidobacteria bacterium RIFCSPLOWO2_12_FULL_68_19]